jgi:hypothetical protein
MQFIKPSIEVDLDHIKETWWVDNGEHEEEKDNEEDLDDE